MSDSDRRAFSRVPFRVRAALEGDHASRSEGEVRDLSLKGLYLVGASRVPSGACCDLRLMLDGLEGEMTLRIRARVIRADVDGMAMEFLEMGLETFQHLRNIVRYNSEDAATVEAEFHAHLGLLPREEMNP